MQATSHPRVSRPAGWLVIGIVAALLVTGLAVGSFVIRGNSGGAGGEQNPASPLPDFPETGVAASTTTAPLPVVLSILPATPTRLAAAATSYLLDAGTVGDQAVAWTFSEAVGIPANQELEVAFSVQYDVAAVAHSAQVKVYVETQATLPRVAVAFTLYWDAGAATGITFVSEAEIAEACSAVGTCP
jgi:hypothetical protein